MSANEDRLLEWIATYERKEQTLEAELASTREHLTKLREDLAAERLIDRAMELAEEGPYEVTVHNDSGTVAGKVTVVCSPWQATGVGGRVRYVAAGIEGRWLVAYSLRDTRRARGNVKLTRLYGYAPVQVDLALDRHFSKGAR